MINTSTDESERGDLLPLCGKEGYRRHLDILASLRLELKIAADGMPELAGLSAGEVLRRTGAPGGRRSSPLENVNRAAAAVFSHELYFENIVGRYPSLPEGAAERALKASFGSAGNFFYLVRTAAAATTDPGFLWLYEKRTQRRRGKSSVLGLVRLGGYDLPDRMCRPLMCIDLWEHAYMDTWSRDISGYADSYLRQTDWNRIFGNGDNSGAI